jgi:hypothetical protein
MAAHSAFSTEALNYLLSVLAQAGQTPNTVFAQDHLLCPGERFHLTGGFLEKPGGVATRSHQTLQRRLLRDRVVSVFPSRSVGGATL